MDIEKAINKILWGRALVKANGRDGQEKTFTLRSLTLQEQNEIDFLRETVLQECKEEGILLEEELVNILAETGAWTEKDDANVKSLEKEVRRCQHGIRSAEFNATKRRLLEKKLSKTKEELSGLTEQRAALMALTAESRAEEFVRRYMIFMSATDKLGRQIWETEEDFLATTDFELVDCLTLKYLENHIMQEEDLRMVARSGMWRFRWSASKNGESLFGKPVAEWSELQSALVYWSQFYDFVFDSPDRPSDNIIENDNALDAWVRDQQGDSSGSSTASNAPKVKGAIQEQFIVVPDGDKETINKVHSMNSKADRRKISAERNEIKEKGRVSEWELRKGDQ